LTFVDTSALLSIIDRAEQQHERAAQAWRELVLNDESLLTTSYVVVELFALAQRRLGIAAVEALDAMFSVIDIVWIDAEIHRIALTSVLAASRRHLSLVDCASFEVMRRRGIRTVFALDSDFSDHCFDTIP
jgi:predicted nucleic acid-binding protein